MPEKRRQYDRDFREGAVQIVRETGKTQAEVARDLGIHPGTLGTWMKRDRLARGERLGPQARRSRATTSAGAGDRRAQDGA